MDPYDASMEDLRQQLALELAPPPPPSKPAEAFQLYSATYLRYLSIYSRLEAVYETLPGAQARLELGEVLSLVLARMLTCRGLAAKWHPVPPDVLTARAGQPYLPLAWECLDCIDCEVGNDFIEPANESLIRSKHHCSQVGLICFGKLSR